MANSSDPVLTRSSVSSVEEQGERVDTGSREPDAIQRDIHTIRSRMDGILDELEFRLSPGQVSGGALGVLRDVAEGNPTRLAQAIRSNPWPLALVAAGALWMAWTVSRTPEVDKSDGESDGSRAQPHLTNAVQRQHMSALVATCQKGARALRATDLKLGDQALRPRLIQLASQLDRSATALESELRRLGGPPSRYGADATRTDEWRETADGCWREVERGLSPEAPVRGTVFAAVEHGMDQTLGLFRSALAEPLPARMRVVVGTHFHDIETLRHRIGVFREMA